MSGARGERHRLGDGLGAEAGESEDPPLKWGERGSNATNGLPTRGYREWQLLLVFDCVATSLAASTLI
jgi:hypothetical protein